MSFFGKWNVALIGGSTPAERSPSALMRALEWHHPQRRRDRIKAEQDKTERARLAYLDSIEGKGRPVGTVAGTWVTDYAELKRCITLCYACVPKFNPARYQYVHDTHLDARGICTGCRDNMERKLEVYVHESIIGHNYELARR